MKYLKSLLLLLILSNLNAFSQAVVSGNNFGYTQGSFQATDAGAATYSIPFILPPGTAGLQPKIGLSYSSQSGNSFVGFGWNLTGLSVISRSTKTRAQDETSDINQQTKAVELGINYSNNKDRFSLDGERLVLAPESINTQAIFDANYGANTTVYNTEQNNFTRVQFFTNSSGSSSYFIAETKSGLKFEYGRTTSSRVMNSNEDPDKYVVIQWLVNKIEDKKGNYMTFTYTQDAITGEVLPARIDYTGNATAGLATYNRIDFEYITHNTPNTAYGIRFQTANQFTKLLKSVKIYYQNTLLREYSLSHSLNNQTYLLSQVQECDGAGTCFKPTTFQWSNDITNQNTTPVKLLTFPGEDYQRVFGDFNGDGLVDYAYWDVPNTSTVSVKYYFNTGAESGTSMFRSQADTSLTYGGISTNKFSIQSAELNGDNITDIIVRWQGSGINSYQILSSPKKISVDGLEKYKWGLFGIAVPLFANDELNLLVDINRDGISDYIDYTIDNPTNVPTLNKIRISKTIIKKPQDTQQLYEVVANTDLTLSGYNLNWPNTNKPVQLVDDIDNDGFTDIFIYDKISGENIIIFPYSYRTLGEPETRKNQFQARVKYGHRNLIQPTYLDGNLSTVVQLADLNSDGYPDIFYAKPSSNQVCIIPNKGMGYRNSSSGQYVDAIFETDVTKHKCTTLTNNIVGQFPLVQPFDYDADGLLDIMFYDSTSGNSRTFINQGNFVFDFNNIGGIPNALPTYRFIENKKNPAVFGAFFRTSHSDLYYQDKVTGEHYVQKMHQSQGFKIKRITNGAGLITQITYQNILNTTVYERLGDATFPNVEIQSPLYVVSKVETYQATPDKRTTTYKYTGAIINIEGRGFRGFTRVRETNEETGIYEVRYYDQSDDQWKMTGSTLLKTERFNKAADLISVSIHKPTFRGYPDNAFAKCFHAYYQIDSTFDFINNKYQVIERVNDTNGNPASIEVDYGNGFVDKTINTYADNTTTWLLGRLVQSDVYRSATGQSTVHKQAKFTYDNTTGYLVSETSDSNLATEYQIQKNYTYDVFGNITNSSTTAWNGSVYETRSIATEFDATTHRFITQTTNPIGHVSTATYDQSLGVVLTQTDLNGLTTSFIYDGFSRLKKQTFPDGTWTNIDFREKNSTLFRSPSNAVFLTYTQSSNGQVSIEHFDAYNRSIQNKTKGFDGTWVKVDHTFGRITTPEFRETVKDTYPYYDGDTPEGYSERQIDELGRIVTNETSGSNEIRRSHINYNGLTVENINFVGQIQKSTSDTKGRIIESIDNQGNRLRFTYDAADRLLTTKDPKNNTITNVYNDRGDKIQMTDPDMGTYKYEYNGFGELLKQTYPDNKIVTFTYDKLGRTKNRIEEEGTTIYTYDIGNKAKGKLSSVNGFVSDNTYTFDNLGRKSQETTTVDGKTFTTSYTYDAQSRVNTITYPAANLVLKHIYNARGYLTQLQNGAGNKLWEVLLMDASGAIIQQDFGNGVMTEQLYELTTRYLQYIKSIKGTTVLQHYSYQFDEIGNLIKRKDEKRNNYEDFDYDNLNRLIRTQINGNITKSTTIEYDILGNITRKSDVGDYSYVGAHKLIDVRTNNKDVSCSFTNGINTSYNTFNKVKRISKDTAFVDVFYWPDQQRVLQKMYVNNILTRTKIYLGLSEIEYFSSGLTRTTNYIGGIGIQITESQGNNTTSKIQYYLKDHLGSVTGFTDEAGALIEEYSYDAWGKRRNIDWTIANNISPTHERGFTNHEHYDIFDIIDMNGRIYDPTLGRFLQPDPFIQDPYYLQSYNRYAYVLNNPLSLSDPTGYNWFSDIWGGITGAIGSVVNFVIDNWKPIVTIAIGVAIAAYTGGVGVASWQAAFASGTAAGFGSSIAGTLLNGGSLTDALKSGIRSAIIGGITAVLTYGVGQWAKTIDASVGKNSEYYGIKILGHGVVQGTMAELNGGRFIHGFVTGAISGGTEDFIADNFSGGTSAIAASAIVGGVTSELTGGTFLNGAMTGAFVMMFNQMAIKNRNNQKAVTIEEFLEEYRGKDVPYEYSKEIGNLKYRFVTDPLYSNNEIDMRHFMWTGAASGGTVLKGELYGIAVELSQAITCDIWNKHCISAYDPQDFYSNRLGAQFFHQRGSLFNGSVKAGEVYYFLKFQRNN